MHLDLPVCGWGGLGGLTLNLSYNSQSNRATALGARWTHSYNLYLVSDSPGTMSVIAGNGIETLYSQSGANWLPPTGVYDSLAQNPDTTWTLNRKDGTKALFGSNGLLSSLVDTNGNAILLGYAANLLTITDPAGRTVQLGFTNGLITSVTDCQGRVWSLLYDASNRLVQIVDPLISGQSYSRQVSYDANGRVGSLTNRLGKVWQYATGNSGIYTGASDPDTLTTALSYVAPSAGMPATAHYVARWTDPGGTDKQHAFDNIGRLVSVLDNAGNQTSHTYDAANNRLSTQFASGLVWQSQWDNRGNELVTQDPLGRQTVRTFGVYDQVVTVTDSNNHQTQNGYDQTTGNLTSVTDGANQVTQHFYNGNGTRRQTVDAQSRVVNLGYDQYGHQSSTTVVKDANTSFVTQLVFDAGSHLTQRTGASGRVSNYAQDAWGRTTGVSYPTTGNPGISLALDPEGNLTQSTDGTGIRNYTYDNWGRRKTATDPRGNTQASYDNVGNLLSQTDVTQRPISNAFNTLQQLTLVTDGNDLTHADYTYTADGQASTALYPNGIRVEWGYDNAGRTNSIVHRVVSTNAVLIGYSAQYDPGGRLSSITEQPSGDVTAFTYDNADRLLSEQRIGTRPYSGTYAYDNSGLRTAAVIVTNGVTTHNGVYSYDGAGRLVQVVDSATGLTELYTWNNDGTLASAPGSGYTKQFAYDEESRLTSISHDAALVYQYAYGADGGRRWRKDIAASLWTWYPCGVACSAGELVEQTSDLTGAVWSTAALYLRGGSGCSARIIRRNSEYHHADIPGAFPVITNGNGSVLSSNLYDRFGVQRFANGSAATPWRWSEAREDGLIRTGGSDYLPERNISGRAQVTFDCVPKIRNTDKDGVRACTGARLAQCEHDCKIYGGLGSCCETYHWIIQRRPYDPPPHWDIGPPICFCKSMIPVHQGTNRPMV